MSLWKPPAQSPFAPWEYRLHEILPLYGHRNWIVVADSAYPEQSRPGIETVVSTLGQIETVQKVLGAIAAAKHIRANIYLDRELAFVAEPDAPGISKYRAQLAGLPGITNAKSLPHDEIITRLDQAAQLFKVYIVKTALTLPYTSVFFELDCGYWSAEAEERLRHAMHAASRE